MVSQKGQVLLIVVLVLVIISTIGLSVASRSITSLKTSTEEQESQKALSAAEAGIERAIQSNAIPTGVAIQGNNSSNNSSYTTTITQIQSSSFLLNGGSTTFGPTPAVGPTPTPIVVPNVIPKDEGADVWFVKHDDNGNPDYTTPLSPQFLNIYWGSVSEQCNTSNAPAAIEAIVVTKNPANPADVKTYRYAYDSCNRGNNFKSADSGSYNVFGISGVTFGNKTPNNDLAKNINNIILMRVIPIYKNTVIGINTCNSGGNNCTALPSQGYVISSTGISGSANVKLTTFEGYLQIYLPFLSYGLFVAN